MKWSNDLTGLLQVFIQLRCPFQSLLEEDLGDTVQSLLCSDSDLAESGQDLYCRQISRPNPTKEIGGVKVDYLPLPCGQLAEDNLRYVVNVGGGELVTETPGGPLRELPFPVGLLSRSDSCPRSLFWWSARWCYSDDCWITRVVLAVGRPRSLLFGRHEREGNVGERGRG